jgi:hypothetical protein
VESATQDSFQDFHRDVRIVGCLQIFEKNSVGEGAFLGRDVALDAEVTTTLEASQVHGFDTSSQAKPS